MALPLSVLNKSINKKIILSLKDGRILEGVLIGYDEHMNLVLIDVEEKDSEGNLIRKLGKVILRGNNIVTISPTL